MRRIVISILVSACAVLLPTVASAQENEGVAKEVYTGTIVNMSGRAVSTGFTLTLTGRTSDDEARRLLSILASEGQEGLMKAIRKNDLGFIAATGQTRRNLLIVRDVQVEGKRRVIAAFERWLGFFELRSGTRSLDHPFSIIEIYFDQKGKGSGTFIGLCQLKLEQDKKTEQMRLELENFGSFPAKVMGVIRRGK